MDLEGIRKNISRTDAEIIKLLNKRFELALKTKKFKSKISDDAREQDVLSAVKRNSQHLIKPEFTEKLYNEIIAESKKLQDKNLKLIGFQGEHGAYGELAVRAYDQSAAPIPCLEFAEVFEGVKTGELDLGVVPVENSLAGSVSVVNDLLVETDLNVIGEIIVPIHHCLLALPETDYRDVKVVYSHPQALAQCRGFITRNKLEPRPYYDTAGAALMLANDRLKAAAAIASKLCAELYELEVLKENIEDHESNATRFLVLSKDKAKEKGNKCSIVFSTQHKAGALFSVLKIFAEVDINLTRIESRPVSDERNKFAFLLDFQGSDADKKVSDALEKVKKEAAIFKLLGCYNEAKL